MTARAFLNVVETRLLEGLDGEARAGMRWSIRNPVAFAAEQQKQNAAALLDAGGEIG